MVNTTMFEETENTQSMISEVREEIPFDGGIMVIAPPASGQMSNGQAWKHDYKVEIYQGKQVIKLVSEQQLDSLARLLNSRRVQSFKSRMPKRLDSSALDQEYGH